MGCRALCLLLLSMLSFPASASTLVTGLISYDVVIPAGTAPGVDALDIFNFTGPAYGPFAGTPYVVDPVNFFNATLTVYLAGGGSDVQQIGTLFPGETSPIGFPSTTQITSAVLTATLGQSILALSDGSTFMALADITVDLLPSSGGALTAGVDFAAIDAQSVPAPVPEPGTVILLPLGILTMLARGRR